MPGGPPAVTPQTGAVRGNECSRGHVPADRGLRDHRRPAHGRPGRQERLDRLPVVPDVRLADDLRRAPRRREGRPLQHLPPARDRRHQQADVPPRHEHPHHALPRDRGGRRGVRLHARRHPRARPPLSGRPPGEDRSGEHRLRALLRAALRLRAGRSHDRAARRRDDLRLEGRGRDRPPTPARRAGDDHGRRRGGRVVHPPCRREARVRRGGGRAGRDQPVRRSRLRVACVQGDVELLAHLDRALALRGPLARDGRPLGARPQAARLPGPRLARRGRDVRAPRGGSVASATGTTATRGSGTRRSRCTR